MAKDGNMGLAKGTRFGYDEVLELIGKGGMGEMYRGSGIAPDGQRFLMVQPAAPDQPATQINVDLSWFEELKRKVQVG